MTVTKLMKGSALGALAIAMATTVLPAQASAAEATAQERPDRERGERRQERRSERREVRQERREVRQERRAEPGPRIERTAPVESMRERQIDRRQTVATAQSRGEERRGRDWNQSQRRAEVAQERQGRNWNRSESRDDRRDDRRAERRDGNRDAARIIRRERVEDARREAYRDGRRDERRGDYRENREIRRDAYRDGYRDARRSDRNDRRARYYDGRRWHDYDRWDHRHWRSNTRYDWYRYRNHNHSIFRLGRYYAPYRGYSYRRLNIGFYLGDLFFGSRYWINDPWRYRLPEVYGPYRWVRYYDDVLLVDIYSGEVVDVIYDFFW
ncbi:RcnB family protein [Qipengyuania gaetbuli]|nr:RcnB family protein [Qipengyuania gaetbuli]